MGSHSLLQGTLPMQGLNPGPLHCTQVLYCLSHQGSPSCTYQTPNNRSINKVNIYYSLTWFPRAVSSGLLEGLFSQAGSCSLLWVSGTLLPFLGSASPVAWTSSTGSQMASVTPYSSENLGEERARKAHFFLLRTGLQISHTLLLLTSHWPELSFMP